jgi:hypothetical protein
MPENISAQNVCPSPKIQKFWKKNWLWVSVVRAPFRKAKYGPYE